jgi:hypothetical protein
LHHIRDSRFCAKSRRIGAEERKHRGRPIIYYSILNPNNPTLQPAISADLL